MAVLLLAAGGSREVMPADGHEFTIEELHGYVGGFIEIHRMPAGFLVCNEDGHRLELPYNAAATYALAMTRMYGPVLGDVLICGPGEIS